MELFAKTVNDWNPLDLNVQLGSEYASGTPIQRIKIKFRDLKE